MSTPHPSWKEREAERLRGIREEKLRPKFWLTVRLEVEHGGGRHHIMESETQLGPENVSAEVQRIVRAVRWS
jgi:hypothetical protein